MNNILVRLRQINPHLLAYATVFVAFFLRVYRLADKNIWWDEGWSIWLAKQDFVAIALRTAADEHPPLHYWMLKVWGALFGSSAYSDRFLSVAFGVLTIALIYRIGKRVGGVWIGELAAFLLAISRFHIWWSQDIKNYTPSIFFAFAALWFGLGLIADGKWQMGNGEWPRARYLLSAISYSLFAALAMFTHYLAALVLLALNVYAVTVILSQAKNLRMAASPSLLSSPAPLLKNWIIANFLAAILFFPWMYLYLQNAQAWTAQPVFDFGLFLKLVATVLPLGVTTNIDNYTWLTSAFTILAALAVVSDWRTVGRQNAGYPLYPVYHTLLFVLIVALPPLLIYLLSHTPAAIFAPKIQARYLVVLAPAYAILVALGIAFLARWTRYTAFAAMIFIIASNAFVLKDYYAERRLRDEYATLANTINAFARQGDLVLLDTDQEWPTFLYYLRARLDWVGVPNGAPMTDSNADLVVRRALNRSSAVWLVAIPDALATDPQKMIEARLARDLSKRFDQTFGDKRVVLYAPDERDLVQVLGANLQIQHPLPFIPFRSVGDANQYQAQLIGYDLPIREVRAGDTMYATTYWFALSTRGEMQLVDSRGRAIFATPFDLATGKDIRVVTPLYVPPNALGEHSIRVRVGEQTAEIARVHVEPRSTSAGAETIAHPTDYRFGEAIHLIGYDLPQTQFRAGDPWPITIYWRTDQPVAKNYLVFVHLLGERFNASQNNFLWGQIDRVPRDGAYPTTAWQPGQTVADPYRVPIASNAPAGKYKLEVGMYDAVTGARLKLSDGSDSVIIAEIEIIR